MAFPACAPVIDTMIGVPHMRSEQYDFIRRQTKDRQSRDTKQPDRFIPSTHIDPNTGMDGIRALGRAS
ncbi:hypothetical protein ABT009_25365 [Streptomyces sp. NPDC002896]|uniref:hypothetical protein n=1 Tax=Streptomyces sp. NPDC002896 TaxID=3154438 RepID=UPI00332A2110